MPKIGIKVWTPVEEETNFAKLKPSLNVQGSSIPLNLL